MNSLKVYVLFMSVCVTSPIHAQEKPDSKEMEKLNMTITRTFDAPVKKVWEAWSKDELVKKWWGPEGFTAPTVEMDFREGGSSFVCMNSPDYGDMYNTWTYQRIIPMEKIEFVSRFADKDRNQLDPTDMGLPPGIPKETPHTILFKEVGDGKTEVTIIERGYGSKDAVELSKAGMGQCLDKMEKIL